MTYALFVFDRPDSLAGLDEHVRQAIFSEYEALQKVSGLAGHRLAPAPSAVTVRIKGGERTVEVKPFAEHIPLAGYYLLDTEDPERALEIAGRIPAARLGGAVEVRALIGEP